jgi:hypothetical protein
LASPYRRQTINAQHETHVPQKEPFISLEEKGESRAPHNSASSGEHQTRNQQIRDSGRLLMAYISKLKSHTVTAKNENAVLLMMKPCHVSVSPVGDSRCSQDKRYMQASVALLTSSSLSFLLWSFVRPPGSTVTTCSSHARFSHSLL